MSLVTLLLVLAPSIGLFFSRQFIGRTNAMAPINVPDAGPYRTADPFPQSEPIKQPKPKREFKMPEIKLSNSMKAFLMLLPVCVCAVIIGTLYDLSFPSLGIRVGMGFAIGFVGCYFIVSLFIHLRKCSNMRY